ncbi:MAG: class I SAM-dependent methyltransferase [Thiofilum sp.]|uniref:class I SAM-dependent methyltransferase n=1 Tax=Thiofilum sp. TaxID=2212733 RepID=UPI0025D6FB69|nr:class I SAM-dependent methyltransferase [Thiofilum sp.]MBK8453717.1 class I SAM-dependent methyltransferase [Thiofilum sp.]
MRYQLVQTAERLELHDTQDPQMGAVYVDFIGGKAQHRLQFGGGKGQDIAKAIGLNKYAHPYVVDATAGLGRESFVLASLGCKVLMLERNPTVYALLEDGLKRAQACTDEPLQTIIERMSLERNSAQSWLSTLTPDHYPDVIYLDPMFPERQKSALVQKEMRFFHTVVGNDEDDAELVDLARHKVHKRVVVKRPHKAPWLGDNKPAFVIGAKAAIRFDVYLPYPSNT